MGDLGRREQVGCAIGTRSDTSPASDTGRSVEGGVGGGLRDRDHVGVGGGTGLGGYVATGFDDPVEGAPVDHQIPDQGEPGRPPGLDRDRGPVVELAHVQLTRRSSQLGAVRLAVDHHAAGAANPLPAVVVECDRLLALVDQPLVEHVQHLEKRHVGRDAGDLVGLEPARLLRPLLPPHLERHIHRDDTSDPGTRCRASMTPEDVSLGCDLGLTCSSSW